MPTSILCLYCFNFMLRMVTQILIEDVCLILATIFFQCIPYEVLVQQLDMKNLRELEDLVIEAIYGGLLELYRNILYSI